MNGPPSEANSELGRAGFLTLSKLVTATSTSSEIQCREIQTEVLATCSGISESLQKILDVGVEHLLVSRTAVATKPGSLSALLQLDAGSEIKLTFRGAIAPSAAVGTMFPGFSFSTTSGPCPRQREMCH